MDIIAIYNARNRARSDMEIAKKYLGNKGTSEYYMAVKKYYMAVNKFLSLVSSFPSGYSQSSFTNAISQYKSDCESAYQEVKFYE